MAANQNSSGNMDDMDNCSEEDFSIDHFERQWSRYLANFQLRRLRYVDLFSAHNDALFGMALSSDGQQDMPFEDAIIAASDALYNNRNNNDNNNTGDKKRCCNCSCKCNQPNRL